MTVNEDEATVYQRRSTINSNRSCWTGRSRGKSIDGYELDIEAKAPVKTKSQDLERY